MKLHLGCGKRYIPGFVHIDLDTYPHIDYQRDARDLSVFADGTIELIYASHLFEYFDVVERLDVLYEWLRVLRPAGILRLAVPDFEAMVEVYLKYGDLGLIHGPLYGHWPNGERHCAVYDFATLRAVLRSAGFQHVHRYDWRETIHRDYDDYSQAYIPHMDKEHGILISLNVEAEKAGA